MWIMHERTTHGMWFSLSDMYGDEPMGVGTSNVVKTSHGRNQSCSHTCRGVVCCIVVDWGTFVGAFLGV